MKRILLTGGFSAGHVTPNLALIPKLQALGYDVVYVGQDSGIEKDLVAQTGITYDGIQGGKLRRYLDLENLTDIGRILYGTLQSYFIIRKRKPDVVFSKGGFVACPPVWAAWLNRVPIIIHESDLSPGLANRLSTPFAHKICYSFPETKAYISPEKGVHTGIPIRAELLSGSLPQGQALCGFTDDKPIVMIMGGSQGSVTINNAIRDALDDLLPNFQVCHLCGRGNTDAALEAVAGYKQFDYVDQALPDLLAMADVVISRAGATTIFELLTLKKPHVLIPLPLSASRGDQILNAESFEKQGFSQVLAEENLNTSSLTQAVQYVYENRDGFSQAMASSDAATGLERVLSVIQEAS
ncbi:MAG: undecaprenyldiphospho-muramoylpentapeptide beta-N-acetylglucosaminyltransferase [Chloroflexota bacterium]